MDDVCLGCGAHVTRKVRRAGAKLLPRQARLNGAKSFPYCEQCAPIALHRVWTGKPIRVPDSWDVVPPTDADQAPDDGAATGA